MFLSCNRRLPHFALSASACFYTAVFLLLTQCCDGQFQMVVPSKSVVAMLGTDVVLSCHLEPEADVTHSTMEWARVESDLNPRFVHLRRDGVELPTRLNPQYVGRTNLSSISLKHGDLSLRLSSVIPSDEGTYKCDVPGKASAQIRLHVGTAPPNISISAEANHSSGGMAFGCESAGWYPKPTLLWLDSEGKHLSAGHSQTHRSPDGLYNVSSRVNVKEGATTMISCQVRQNVIGQNRTVQFSFNVAGFNDTSSSAARVIIVLISAVGFIILSSFVLGWRKQKPNKSSDNEPKDEEKANLLEKSPRMEDLGKEMTKLYENLKEKREEEKDLACVIELLKEFGEELQKSMKQQEFHLKKVEEKMTENEKQLKKLFMLESSKKDIRQRIELEQNEKQKVLYVLQRTNEKALETANIIKIITRQKENTGTKIHIIEEQMNPKTEKQDREQRRGQLEETCGSGEATGNVESKGNVENKGNVETKVETKGNFETKGNVETKVEVKGNIETKVETKVETKGNVESKVESTGNVETKGNVEPKGNVESKVESTGNVETNVETKGNVETKVETKGNGEATVNGEAKEDGETKKKINKK